MDIAQLGSVGAGWRTPALPDRGPRRSGAGSATPSQIRLSAVDSSIEFQHPAHFAVFPRHQISVVERNAFAEGGHIPDAVKRQCHRWSSEGRLPVFHFVACCMARPGVDGSAAPSEHQPLTPHTSAANDRRRARRPLQRRRDQLFTVTACSRTGYPFAPDSHDILPPADDRGNGFFLKRAIRAMPAVVGNRRPAGGRGLKPRFRGAPWPAESGSLPARGVRIETSIRRRPRWAAALKNSRRFCRISRLAGTASPGGRTYLGSDRVISGPRRNEVTDFTVFGSPGEPRTLHRSCTPLPSRAYMAFCATVY